MLLKLEPLAVNKVSFDLCRQSQTEGLQSLKDEFVKSYVGRLMKMLFELPFHKQTNL